MIDQSILLTTAWTTDVLCATQFDVRSWSPKNSAKQNPLTNNKNRQAWSLATRKLRS